MKIAFLSFYSGSVFRGAETFTHEIANRLSRNHEVVVFQQGIRPKGAEYEVERIAMDVDWERGNTQLARYLFVDYWSRLIAIFTLRALPKIWKEKYDIVFPLNGGWQPAFLRLLTWAYGGKLVVSGQSGMGWDDRNNLWSFPNAFIALSQKALSWAKKANPFVKSTYIPNGVDLKKFKEKGKEYKTSLKKPVVLCVGALTEQKRVDRVIKAVSKLDDASLLVVGNGGERKELEKLGKKLLGDRFELTSVRYDRMPEIYRAGDVFTLVPFGSEAFGIVFVEAMATNLPVVTVKDKQREEIVGEGGILVDPRDQKKYLKALKEALSKKWGDKPRKQAEKFSWDKIAKKYEKLFREI